MSGYLDTGIDQEAAAKRCENVRDSTNHTLRMISTEV